MFSDVARIRTLFAGVPVDVWFTEVAVDRSRSVVAEFSVDHSCSVVAEVSEVAVYHSRAVGAVVSEVAEDVGVFRIAVVHSKSQILAVAACTGHFVVVSEVAVDYTGSDLDCGGPEVSGC